MIATKTKYVESALGIKTVESTARKIDELLPTLPAHLRRVASKSSFQTEASEDSRTDLSYVSTIVEDRHNEIVLPEGIIRDEFMLNPVILYGHNQDFPIGKCLWIKPDAKGLVAKSQYTSRPKNYIGEWLPDFVFAMILDGVLCGKSVQYIPLEDREPNDDERITNPNLRSVITKCMLLEYSVVSIPANPQSLVQVVTKGLNAELMNWKVLGRVKGVEPVKAAVQKPRVKSYQQIAAKLDRFKLDPAKLAQDAVDEIMKRWAI